MFGSLSRVTQIQLNGYLLNLDPRDRVITKKLALYGEYEEYIRELLLSFATPGTVVVDVGANVGLHTVPLADRLGRGGRVIAFEPDPDNYRILLSNIEANGLTNVTPYKLALSAVAGTALLFQSQENRGGLSLSRNNVDEGHASGESVSIEAKTGDSILLDLKTSISLIKMDVEGAEPLVFEGMKETLDRNRSARILFEFWPRYVSSFHIDPLDFLVGLEQDGFNLHLIDGDARRLIPLSPQEIVKEGEVSREPLSLLAERAL
jgi:FkbM family methyltransferase